MATTQVMSTIRRLTTSSSREMFANHVKSQLPAEYRQMPLGLRHFNPPAIPNPGATITCEPCLCRRLEAYGDKVGAPDFQDEMISLHNLDK